MSSQSPHVKTTSLLEHKSALVMGLGVTGYSVVRFLRKHGMDVAVMDSRPQPPKAAQLQAEFPEVKTYLGKLDADLMASYSLLVASPGLDLATEEFKVAKRAGALIVGDIELFMQVNQKPLIAITGSNGKSTVTTLVGKMCEAGGLNTLVAGNIGYPALDALTDETNYDVAVLELSSFQLEATMSVPADAATILNISPDHMDRYESMGDYMLAKARIFRGAKRAVLPRHQENLRQISTTAKTVTFGLDEPASKRDFGVAKGKKARWLVRGGERLVKLKSLSLLGMHNVENVLAAFALVEFLKLPRKPVIAAVKSFKGLPHRMETVASSAGVRWVNDSKATNIGAAATALNSLDADLVWIAGGQGKGADFTELRKVVSNRIKLVVLLGEDADQIEHALQDRVEIVRVADMKEAVLMAGQHASEGMVVLLSPACASFDMYQSFAQRGDDFRSLAEAWAEVHGS